MKSFSLFFAMLLILIAVVGGASHQQATIVEAPVLNAAQRIEHLSVPAPLSVPVWMVTNMAADSASLDAMVSTLPESSATEGPSTPSAMREDVELAPSTMLMATQNVVMCTRVEDLAESVRKLDNIVASAKGTVEEKLEAPHGESEKSITQKIVIAPAQLEDFLGKLKTISAGAPVTKVVKAQKEANTEKISSLIMVNQQSLSDLQEFKKSTKNVVDKLKIEEEIRKVSSELANLNTQKDMALQQGANCIVLVSLYQDMSLATQNASLGAQLAEAFMGGLGNTKEILIKLVANWPFLVLAFIFLVWHFVLSGSDKRRAEKAKLQEEFERALIGTQVVVTR